MTTHLATLSVRYCMHTQHREVADQSEADWIHNRVPSPNLARSPSCSVTDKALSALMRDWSGTQDHCIAIIKVGVTTFHRGQLALCSWFYCWCLGWICHWRIWPGIVCQRSPENGVGYCWENQYCVLVFCENWVRDCLSWVIRECV